MKAFIYAALLFLVSVAPASAQSPLDFSLRLEQVWQKTASCATCLPCGTSIANKDRVESDVLASLAASLRLGGSNFYGIGHVGQRFNADKPEGALGLEYRFAPYVEKPPARKATKARRYKRPCD